MKEKDLMFSIREKEKEWIKQLDDKMWAFETSYKGALKYTTNHSEDILNAKVIAYNTNDLERLQEIISFVVNKLISIKKAENIKMEYLKQLVIEDVPHQYQERLLNILTQ